jgi:hypothetical protein
MEGSFAVIDGLRIADASPDAGGLLLFQCDYFKAGKEEPVYNTGSDIAGSTNHYPILGKLRKQCQA